MEVEMDINGGTNYVSAGTTELISVPYALYAQTAGSSMPGPQGPVGPQGPIGLTGATGSIGATGATGPQGPQGLTGATGPQGPIGLTGATGSVGATGATGPQGIQGLTGATGPQGPIGLTGATGSVGATGATGTQGPQGLTGATGPQGPIGLTGATGSVGATGTSGVAGSAGTNGTNGLNGTNGTNGQNTLVNTTAEPTGTNCASGGTKIEVGLDANNNGTLDASEINASLTKYVCNGTGNSGNSNSTIHGYVQYTNTGILSNWIVPNGISLVEISMTGSEGGVGGNNQGCGGFWMGNAPGGVCGRVKLLLSVNSSDTIKYFLGNNGQSGANMICTGPCPSAGSGTSGSISYLKINGTILNIYGGTGGTGCYFNCATNQGTNGISGTSGYIDTSNILSSGAIIINNNNDYNLGTNTILIRY
jgi:hypothetical protein